MAKVITDLASPVSARAYAISPSQKRNPKARHYMAADRHMLVDPKINPEEWARNLILSRVSDLFKTAAGLRGHAEVIQSEISRARVSKLEGLDGSLVARIITSIKEVMRSLEKSKKAAPFPLSGTIEIRSDLTMHCVVI